MRARLIEATRDAATPIDFEGLIQAGVLAAASRGWYEVLDMKRLPKHASKQVTAIKSVTKNGKSRAFLKFEKCNARAAKLYEQLTGRKFQVA